MDYFFKLILLLFVFCFSSSSFSASRFRPNLSEQLSFSSRNSSGSNISSRYGGLISSREFKTLLNKPSRATFNTSVPYTASSSLGRTTAVSSISLAKIAKNVGLSAVRYGNAGIAIEAAIIGIGWIYDEFTEEERLADPTIIDGEYKTILKPVYSDSTVFGDWNASGQCGTNLSSCPDDMYSATCGVTTVPCEYKAEFASYNPGYNINVYDLFVRHATGEIVPEVDYVPVTLDDIYEELIQTMPDPIFVDFINEEDIKPQIFVTPEFIQTSEDLDDDFFRATDVDSLGFPDLTTEPITTTAEDTNLEGLEVPNYDFEPFTTTDIDVAPDFNTIVDTVTSTSIDPNTFIETTTITTTTTVVDSLTGDVVDTQTDVKRKTKYRPDLDPSFNPETSTIPDPTTTITSDGPSNPLDPPKVEVVNFPAQKTCEDSPFSLGCLDTGRELPKAPKINTYAVDFNVTPFALASTALCPVPVPFTLTSGKTYSIPYQPFCNFASAINPFVVSLGLIISFYIVSGSFKREV